MAKIFRRLINLFKRPKPTPAMRPGRVLGHRGVAAGDLKERHRLMEEFYADPFSGLPGPYTPEEVEQWEMLSGDEVENFVYNSTILPVNSSNVEAVQYIHAEKVMIVKFLPGKKPRKQFYQYSNISEQEAINFAQSFSKGGWVWDNLRVRGSRTAHKKPFIPVGGFRNV